MKGALPCSFVHLTKEQLVQRMVVLKRLILQKNFEVQAAKDDRNTVWSMLSTVRKEMKRRSMDKEIARYSRRAKKKKNKQKN